MIQGYRHKQAEMKWCYVGGRH